jgi:hypothetical protein
MNYIEKYAGMLNKILSVFNIIEHKVKYLKIKTSFDLKISNLSLNKWE